MNRPSIREYVRSPNGQWLYFTSYVVFLVTYFALVCSKRAARRFPLNMVLLGVLVKHNKTPKSQFLFVFSILDTLNELYGMIFFQMSILLFCIKISLDGDDIGILQD